MLLQMLKMYYLPANFIDIPLFIFIELRLFSLLDFLHIGILIQMSFYCYDYLFNWPES